MRWKLQSLVSSHIRQVQQHNLCMMPMRLLTMMSAKSVTVFSASPLYSQALVSTWLPALSSFIFLATSILLIVSFPFLLIFYLSSFIENKQANEASINESVNKHLLSAIYLAPAGIKYILVVEPATLESDRLWLKSWLCPLLAG